MLQPQHAPPLLHAAFPALVICLPRNLLAELILTELALGLLNQRPNKIVDELDEFLSLVRESGRARVLFLGVRDAQESLALSEDCLHFTMKFVHFVVFQLMPELEDFY
jgi:hypothetical protein